MFLRLVIMVVLGFVAYGSMLPAPFKTMDDRNSIVQNKLIQSSHVADVFRQGYFHDTFYYRPLVNLSFMGEYHAFRLNPFFYNLDNLILHILNALLVFALVFRLTNSMDTGFWAGLLFVFHPVQWEAVCNIPGRAILMSAFFVLGAFILFLEFYRCRRWYWMALAVLLFFAGLLCKESAGMLPVVIFVYLCLNHPGPWTQKLKSISPLFLAVAGYLLLRFSFGIVLTYHAHNYYAMFLGFVTFLRSVITDLRLFVFPVDLHYDRCLPFFMSFLYPPALEAIVFWVAAVSAVVYWRRQIPPFVLFLMIWFGLELLPVSQLVTGIGTGTGYVSTAEHFLYMAAVPVFMGMVMAFQWVYERNAQKPFASPLLLKFLAGGFLAFFLLIAIEQSIYASNEFSMLQRSLHFEPYNPRIQGAMGMIYVARNDIPEAAAHFKAATLAEPFNPVYHVSLGIALGQQGQWIESLAQYLVENPGKYKSVAEVQEKIALAHIHRQIQQGKNLDARGWLILGIYYAKIGHVQDAIDAFNKSIVLNPEQPDAWINLGTLYEAMQDWPHARTAYIKMLGIKNLMPFQQETAQNHLTALQDR